MGNLSFTTNAAGRPASLKLGATQRAAYLYDAEEHLVSRTLTNGTPNLTAHLIHDRAGHVIAETNGAGITLREYIWLDDVPVAVVDQANTASPKLAYVHVDHIGRPVVMTDQSQAVVWRATYKPFGEVVSITGPLSLDLRFPGQWFQLESGLSYNWHRHYDPTLGRYTQPDPLGLVALRSDGPSVYGYVGQHPNSASDPEGNAEHHVYPGANFRNADLPKEVKSLFEGATIQVPDPHYYDGAHREYNAATKELFNEYCERNKIDPTKMTKAQAHGFLDELIDSPDSRIRKVLNRSPLYNMEPDSPFSRQSRRMGGFPQDDD